MSGQFPRKPVELPLHDPKGGVACVTAQLLYVFGKTARPDPAAVERASRPRSLDGTVSGPNARYLLVRQGFSVVGIGAYDVQRSLREGKAYLKEFFGDEWSDEHEAYFTPEVLKENNRRDRVHLKRMQPYIVSGKVQDIKRAAVRNDVTRLLRTGYAIDAWFDNGRSDKQRIGTAVLLVPVKTANGHIAVWSYLPDYPGSNIKTVERLSLKEALGWVRYDRTVVGMKL